MNCCAPTSVNMDDATLELAKALIRRPSITPNDHGCQQLIAARLRALGFHVENLRFGSVDNLWTRRGDSAPLLVFAGHSDVVPPGDSAAWKYDPFTPTIDGGMLYGRGAADMKSSLAAFVTAAEAFVARRPDHPGSVALLITSDEEGPAVDGTVKVIDALRRRNENIDYCVVGEPTSSARTGDTIKNGRRGSLSGRAAVYGVQGHVAYPHLAANPVHQMAPVVQALTATEWDTGNEHFPPTSFQITRLHADSGAVNITPERLEMDFNFRFSSQLTPEQLMARVRSTFDKHHLHYDIDWNASGLPYLTAAGPLLDVVKQAVREELDIDPCVSTDGGTSDGRFIAPTGAQVVEFGPTNETIHKVNECLDARDPHRLSRVYLSIMEKLLF